MALLETLKKIDTDINLTELHERDLAGRIEYVETQILEIKAIMWRLRCDVLLNSVIEVENDLEREEQERKVKEYKRDLKRMGQAINVYNELLEELKAI